MNRPTIRRGWHDVIAVQTPERSDDALSTSASARCFTSIVSHRFLAAAAAAAAARQPLFSVILSRIIYLRLTNFRRCKAAAAISYAQTAGVGTVFPRGHCVGVTNMSLRCSLSVNHDLCKWIPSIDRVPRHDLPRGLTLLACMTSIHAGNNSSTRMTLTALRLCRIEHVYSPKKLTER